MLETDPERAEGPVGADQVTDDDDETLARGPVGIPVDVEADGPEGVVGVVEATEAERAAGAAPQPLLSGRLSSNPLPALGTVGPRIGAFKALGPEGGTMVSGRVDEELELI